MEQTAVLTLSFKADQPIIEQTEHSITLRSFEQGELALKNQLPGVVAALGKLATGDYTENQLGDAVFQHNGQSGLLAFYQLMQALAKASIICHTLRLGERPIISLVPIARHYRYQKATPDQPFTLSRFAYLHRDGEAFILDSPLGCAKIVLRDPQRANQLLAHLTQPHTAKTLAQALGDSSEQETKHFLSLLFNAGALSAHEENGTSRETDDPALAQWELHDLIFHSRSRQSRHDQRYGGSFRFQDKFQPLPAQKPAMSAEPIPLYKPDIEQLRAGDMPFTNVLEQRRSLREQGEAPITAQQLGEFLYRVARAKDRFTGSHGFELGLRNLPAGGAIHELEIYPVIDRCDGLASAVYHYDAYDHQLHKVAERSRQVDTLLFLAWITADKKSKPQVYFAITARFQRMQWKYQSMAYAATLKHVGVLYQTMYLVATAMNLAPCALGGGDSDFFATITGLDYYTESQVGEFVLGSRGNE
jgi:SagB-type dehydrogenase family enzyme